MIASVEKWRALVNQVLASGSYSPYMCTGLVLALIQRESSGRVTGLHPDGQSVGLMGVVHGDVPGFTGRPSVDELSDPRANIVAGCEILSRRFAKWAPSRPAIAVMAYHTGDAGVLSAGYDDRLYAQSIIKDGLSDLTATAQAQSLNQDLYANAVEEYGDFSITVGTHPCREIGSGNGDGGNDSEPGTVVVIRERTVPWLLIGVAGLFVWWAVSK